VSPPCRDNEVTSFGAKDNQVVEPVCPSALAKSLIRCGFFGPRAAPPPPVVLKEVLQVHKGKDPIPEVGSSPVAAVLPLLQGSSSFDGAAVKETRRESGTPTNSTVSLSQLWYTRRVKEEVAKQLNKDKDLIVEVVGVIPVVGEVRVANALNLAPVLGLSWGEATVPKVKGMRELKNWDCTISPVKGQLRWGLSGSKNAFSFPPEVH
jgi:hypothetical protein